MASIRFITRSTCMFNQVLNSLIYLFFVVLTIGIYFISEVWHASTKTLNFGTYFFNSSFSTSRLFSFCRTMIRINLSLLLCLFILSSQVFFTVEAEQASYNDVDDQDLHEILPMAGEAVKISPIFVWFKPIVFRYV